jgi:hypothetical protein
MKCISLRITLVAVLIAHVCIAQETLKFQPDKPKPGQKTATSTPKKAF